MTSTQAGPAPSGDVVANLFAPATAADLAAVWGREPLLVRGEPHRYTSLVDEARLRAALASGRPRAAALDHADADEPLTAASTRTITGDDVDAELAAGRTVCVTDLSSGAPELDELARTVSRRLGLPGQIRVNAFLSPPGSGADLHIDARVTISLQVAGRKEWWYGSRPAVPWPRSNAQLLPGGEPVWMYPWCGGESWEQLDPVHLDELEHIVLAPGDLLCLPAGTWHAARARTRSLALNLSVSPADPARALAAMLDPLLCADPLWRGGLAIAPEGHDATQRADLFALRDLARAALAHAEP